MVGAVPRVRTRQALDVELQAAEPEQRSRPGDRSASPACAARSRRTCGGAPHTCWPRSRNRASPPDRHRRAAWKRRTSAAVATSAASGSRPIGRPGSSSQSANTGGHGIVKSPIRVGSRSAASATRSRSSSSVRPACGGGRPGRPGGDRTRRDRPRPAGRRCRTRRACSTLAGSDLRRFTVRADSAGRVEPSSPLRLAAGRPRRPTRAPPREAQASSLPPPAGQPGETHPPRANPLSSTASFADLGVPANLAAVLAHRRHHRPHPDPGGHAARLARRPGRARPRPHRLGQDLRLPPAARGPPRVQPASHQAGRTARADPGPDPRARRPDRGRPRPARRGRRPPHADRLRRRRPEPAGPRPACRRRRRRRLPRPARGPHRPGPLQPRRRRDHRARRGRPHGRPRLPALRTPPAGPDPDHRPADALLGDPRQGRSTSSSEVPASAEDPRGRLGPGHDRDDGPPRAAPQARPAAPGAGRPGQRARPHRRVHPHQARRQGAGPAAQQQRRADGGPARQPQPGRADPQHGGLPLRQGHHARRDRRRRPRHPRRRRRPGGARRPAVRAQGLPAPLRPYGPRRCRGHRRHVDDRRAGARGARADPCRGHQGDHDQGRPASADEVLRRLARGQRTLAAAASFADDHARPAATAGPRRRGRRVVRWRHAVARRRQRPSWRSRRGRSGGSRYADRWRPARERAGPRQSRPHSAASFSSRAADQTSSGRPRVHHVRVRGGVREAQARRRARRAGTLSDST